MTEMCGTCGGASRYTPCVVRKCPDCKGTGKMGEL
jgi:hypothetical protein